MVRRRDDVECSHWVGNARRIRRTTRVRQNDTCRDDDQHNPMPACGRPQPAQRLEYSNNTDGNNEKGAVPEHRQQPISHLVVYFLKIALDILTCTPMVPSTSCVIATSPATLVN